MDKIKELQVSCHGRKVGKLALYKRFFAAFEYDREWLKNGFSISPFSLPLEQRVFIPKMEPFDGIFGVFADSLPDGWGRLLVDRLMRKNGMDSAAAGKGNREVHTGVRAGKTGSISKEALTQNMMRNYLFVIEYDGTRYNGWQKLGNTDNTIQGKLEQVLSRMDGAPVQVIGAGRTDAGVHARGQAANAHLKTAMPADGIRAYANHYLPEDIRVLRVDEAAPRFHCRFHAAEKRYCYYVSTGEKAAVFERKFVYQLGAEPVFRGASALNRPEINLPEMRRASALLCGTHDFTSFCGNRHFKKSAVRTVHEITIDYDVEREMLKFSYRGDGFLQYMIRILTGTLLEVGLGKRKAETMTELLAARDRAQAGYTVPPCGLFLEEVRFAELKK